MTESPVEPDDLEELVRSGSREDIARGLAPTVAGMLARRLPSSRDARAELPRALKALVGSRRKYKDGSVPAWILGTFEERGIGAPGAASREELADLAEVAAAARGLVDRLPAEERDALVLLAVEGLGAREAAEVLGEPAAVIERRAAGAFAELAERLASL
ncbi:MAG: RNA polymerase sigma factor [Planctomycetota bacterium]